MEKNDLQSKAYSFALEIVEFRKELNINKEKIESYFPLSTFRFPFPIFHFPLLDGRSPPQADEGCSAFHSREARTHTQTPTRSQSQPAPPVLFQLFPLS